MSSARERAPGRIAAAPRSALSWKALFSVWLWIWAMDGLLSAFPGCLWSSSVALVAVLTGIPVWAGCAFLGASGAAGKPTSLRAWLSRIRQAFPVYYTAPLFTLVVPALFLSLAWAGGVVGRAPWVGEPLRFAWSITGGLVLSVLGACWIVVGLPSITLQVPASVIEHSHAMDVASRALSYVRRRPLLLAASWIVSAVFSILGTTLFIFFLSVVLGSLMAVNAVGDGLRPELSTISSQVACVWRQAAVAWPFPLPWVDRLEVTSPAWTILVARLAPAFLLASLASCSACVYTTLRLAVDGTPVDQIESK